MQSSKGMRSCQRTAVDALNTPRRREKEGERKTKKEDRGGKGEKRPKNMGRLQWFFYCPINSTYLKKMSTKEN